MSFSGCQYFLKFKSNTSQASLSPSPAPIAKTLRTTWENISSLLWAGTYNTHVDFPGYPKALKNDVILLAGESAGVNLLIGVPPVLLPAVSTVTVTAAAPDFTSRSIPIDVSSGPEVSWSASLSPAVNWLSLESGAGDQAGGLTGADELWLQFYPGNVADGTYSTAVSLNSPNAAPAQIAVTLVRTSSGFFIYLPFTKR